MVSTDRQRHCELRLSNSDAVALIDTEDAPRVSRFTWGLRGNGYIQAGTDVAGVRIRLLLHQFVLFGCPAIGPMIDHRNRIRLDCRKSNLRRCTPSLNQANSERTFAGKTSRYRGVSWCRDRWKASISGVSLGYFHSEQIAAELYDQAAFERFGEFARLNFPQLSLLRASSPAESAVLTGSTLAGCFIFAASGASPRGFVAA